jgi:mono/diheme cytochrome c family protein
MGETMLRRAILACGLVLAAINSAAAETALERGFYLVNTIMACGNCHSPRDADGRIIAGKELSGGLSFDTPAFVATAPNITPDVETGIGSWSDDEIKRSLIEGIRPDHGKLAGDHACELLQGAAAGRPRRHRRVSAQRQAGS